MYSQAASWVSGLRRPARDTSRIVLPPASYAQEQEKIHHRLPAAVKFIRERKLNEVFDAPGAKVGIILQGGMYNGVIRALERLGLADIWGNTQIAQFGKVTGRPPRLSGTDGLRYQPFDTGR